MTTLPPRTPGRDAAISTLRECGLRLARAGASIFLACAAGADRTIYDVEALRALALPCAGSIAVVRSPGSEASSSALCAQLCDLCGSVSSRGAAGRLTVRCSSGIRVERVIGGASPLETTDLEAGESEADGVCFLGALHAAACLSLVLDASGVADKAAQRQSGAPAPIGSVQAALRYTGADGEPRLRTYTLSAPLSASTDQWLASVDVEATTLLAARGVGLHAMSAERETRDPASLAAAADALASSWARLFGEPRHQVQRGWLWNSSTTVGYDTSAPPLPSLLRQLHRLRTSPSALDAAYDADAAHAARLLLLTAPAPLATRVATSMAVSGGSSAEGEDEDGCDAVETALSAAASRLAALSLQQAGAGLPPSAAHHESTELTFDDWCEAVGSVGA